MDDIVCNFHGHKISVQYKLIIVLLRYLWNIKVKCKGNQVMCNVVSIVTYFCAHIKVMVDNKFITNDITFHAMTF